MKSDRIDVRREAAIALGKIQNNRAVPFLISALNDSAPVVRSQAAGSLARLDAKEAVPLLIKQLNDPSRQAAGYAVQALGKLQGNDAIDLLNNLVTSHASDFIRCEALAVLADIDHGTALTAALKCLDDPQKKVIISACKILTRLNDQKAAPKLQELIDKGSSASVRITATASLNKILDPDDQTP